MPKSYRIVFERYDKKEPKKTLLRTNLVEGEIEKATSLLDFSMGHTKQIELIKKSGDCYLAEKLMLDEDNRICPDCQGKLMVLSRLLNHFQIFSKCAIFPVFRRTKPSDI